jgi:dynein heavy chain, axonemal
MVSCCTIDWFFEWPQEALTAVATYLTSTIELPEENDCRGSVVRIISELHQSVTNTYSPEFEAIYKRKNFATPKNYLDFLANYDEFLGNNR